jgi:hypothetical protein
VQISNKININLSWGIYFKSRPNLWFIFEINGRGGRRYLEEELHGHHQEQGGWRCSATTTAMEREGRRKKEKREEEKDDGQNSIDDRVSTSLAP